MEEVWKDISLSTPLSHQHHHHLRHTSSPSPSASYRGSLILQDFLASSAVPQVPPVTAPPVPALPPTALSLSSTLEFTYLGGGPRLVAQPPPSNSSSGDDSRATASPFLPGPFAAPADIFSFGARKHAGPDAAASSGGDRRHRRMIKNRESAARSRARKQAYTNELELALSHLQRENEMLKKQQEELNLRLAMAAQVPDRPTVQRCRSSPL